MRTRLLVLAGLVAAGVAAAGCDRPAGPGPGATTALRQSEEQLIMPEFPEGVIPA